MVLGLVTKTEPGFKHNMGANSDINGCSTMNPKSEIAEEYGPNLKLLPSNNQVRELQTILRDR